MSYFIRPAIALTVAVFWACLSCSAADGKSSLDTQIQPRAEDAIWNYAAYYREDGVDVRDGITVEEVVETKEIEGVTCYLVRLTFDYRTTAERLMGMPLDDDSYSYFWEYENDKGSYNYSCDDFAGMSDIPSSLKEFDLTLPYPVKVGWKSVIGDSVWKVIDADAEVSTPAGTFKCIVYEEVTLDALSPGDSSRSLFYQSPGVGLIRYEWYEYFNDKFVLSSYEELYDYEIK